MRPTPRSSIVASPILIGATTVLIVAVSVFLAYNANRGLPFVPTYTLRAALPSASNLVHDDDVRIGGFRVGQVTDIQPSTVRLGGQSRPVALITMKLDKTIEPLPDDSRVLVRPISTLGLKYVEITPGHSRHGFKAGSTMPLSAATQPVELDQLFNTFDEPTRIAAQGGLVGGGTTFAGRGQALNQAIENFVPFFQHLDPVMRTLADPATGLSRFIDEAARTAATLRPVAAVNAGLFAKMADTFAAIGSDPLALQQTIERTPPTESTAIASFQVDRPFLADSGDLAVQLLPAAQRLSTDLPGITGALRAGRPVLPQTIDLSNRSAELTKALDVVARNPITLVGLEDLRTSVEILRPFLGYIAPYQTVCNYLVYSFTGLADQNDETGSNGTINRVMLKSDNNEQTNRLSTSTTFRPPDVPANEDPRHTQSAHHMGPLESTHGQPYAPAIDAHGNAICQTGQTGFPSGPMGAGRFKPHAADPNFDNYYSGGSHVVVAQQTPGVGGPTFTGISNLNALP